MMHVSAAGAAILLAIAFVSDMRTMRIPNRLNAVALAAGLLFHAAAGAWMGWNGTDAGSGPWWTAVLRAAGQGLAAGLLGAGAGLAMTFPLYRHGALGGGDVKLFAALGSWLGMRETFDCLIYAVLAAGAYGLLCLIIGKERAVRWRLLREHDPVSVREMENGGAASGGSGGQNAGIGKCRFPFMIAVIPGAIAAWLW
jgi:prepilin peptidase CpaA